jgi:hypothetical protein
MYTSNGTELSYSDPIATVNGVNVSHNDLSWTASLGTSKDGYNYWWQGQSGVRSDYEAVLILPQKTMDTSNEDDDAPVVWIYPTRDWRVAETSNNAEIRWLDEIPFTLTGTYNGVTVVQKTMTIVCYVYEIDQRGNYTNSTYRGHAEPWVKNWGVN